MTSTADFLPPKTVTLMPSPSHRVAEDFLILVDKNDKAWGKLEKQMVHQLGLLHRAFSVFVFNAKGEFLLQQRALHKYHSGGLWTNTCCSHPRHGENLDNAIARRLHEEMGLQCETKFMFSFVYKATLDNGLTEHEFDHVFFGVTDEAPIPNAEEVMDWKYIDLASLQADMHHNPDQYTAWFKICFEKILEHYNTYFL